jgi:hypothetical protein
MLRDEAMRRLGEGFRSDPDLSRTVISPHRGGLVEGKMPSGWGVGEGIWSDVSQFTRAHMSANGKTLEL